MGGLIRHIINGRGHFRRARPGAAASHGQTLPAWLYLIFFDVLLPAGGYKTLTEKTTAAAAAADAGVVFYQYGATG